MNRQHYITQDKPMDWQDRVVVAGCAITGLAFALIAVLGLLP